MRIVAQSHSSQHITISAGETAWEAALVQAEGDVSGPRVPSSSGETQRAPPTRPLLQPQVSPGPQTPSMLIDLRGREKWAEKLDLSPSANFQDLKRSTFSQKKFGNSFIKKVEALTRKAPFTLA